MLKEFKEFAMRGNVVDMAVGVIIGGAFGKIVTSLVNDVIMPPIGLLVGRVDFSRLAVILKAADETAPAVAIRYGVFVNEILNFTIVAFCIFFLVKGINQMRKKEPAPAAAPITKECSFCFSLIPLKATRCPSCTSTLH